jgi:hypothetical protein
MKRGFLILFSLLIAFAACKPKDEKTRAIKAEIGGFERDWAATNEILNNWGLQMEQQLTNDSLLSDDCKQLKETYTTEMNNWNVAGKAFEDWKAKFDKGEVKSETATKSLKDYKAIVDKYNAFVEEWTAILKDCVQSATNTDTTKTENID